MLLAAEGLTLTDLRMVPLHPLISSQIPLKTYTALQKRLRTPKLWFFRIGVISPAKSYTTSVMLLTLIPCEWTQFISVSMANCSARCGDSILINGKGAVNCPGVPFLMSLVPPPVLPLLLGANLTDKGCLPLTNPLAQTSYPHNFSAVPASLFEGCHATDPGNATIKADPHQGWVSLNFISTASLQEMVGTLKSGCF